MPLAILVVVLVCLDVVLIVYAGPYLATQLGPNGSITANLITQVGGMAAEILLLSLLIPSILSRRWASIREGLITYLDQDCERLARAIRRCWDARQARSTFAKRWNELKVELDRVHVLSLLSFQSTALTPELATKLVKLMDARANAVHSITALRAEFVRRTIFDDTAALPQASAKLFDELRRTMHFIHSMLAYVYGTAADGHGLSGPLEEVLPDMEDRIKALDAVLKASYTLWESDASMAEDDAIA